VLTISRLLSVGVLCMALAAGNVAVCSGWSASAAARMNCCSDEGNCPMHADGAPGVSSHDALTQAQADACCAWSAPKRSNPSPSIVALSISATVLGTVSAVSDAIALLVPREPSRAAMHLRDGAVRRHIVLSVFLV
jgi:hypothetical protein